LLYKKSSENQLKMFAEELGGNSSRKRAEEAKEKRKRLKELQQKKAARQSLATQTETKTAAGTAVLSTSIVAPLSVAPTTSTLKLSAVEKAAEQRVLRAALAAQHTAAIRIQALCRGVRSRLHQRRSRRQELEQKCSDIETLRTIVAKKSVATYVLPVTMAATLLRQYLFAARIVCSVKREKVPQQQSLLLERLLDLAIIPGLEREGDKNPVAPWFVDESSLGHFRSEQLLLCLLDHLFSHHFNIPFKNSAIFRCLRALLLGSAPWQNKCRWFLFPRIPSRLDVIQRLRYYLLHMSGNQPIPLDAEVKREACVQGQERAGAVLLLILDLLLASPSPLQMARMIPEILTIPLLPWRLSATALSKLVSSSSSSEPLLLQWVQAFTDVHTEALNSGQWEELIEHPDLPMTLCAATASQRLLANLMQFSRLIPACNGELNSRSDFASATTFFLFIAALVYIVPLGTFVSSRESSITWITVDGGKYKPIVLSAVILEQCQSLLVESYVRRMFLAAIDATILQTERVLTQKNEKDLKLEADWQQSGHSSAASLAAKEARMDRHKRFWNSSKWARKLTKGVSNMLVSPDSASFAGSKKLNGPETHADKELMEAVAAGLLLEDTSALSRQLAEGSKVDAEKSSVASKEMRRTDAYSTNLLMSLVQTYAILIARWGGEGQINILNSESDKYRSSGKVPSDTKVTSSQEPWVKSILNVLCFSTPFVQVTWGLIQSDEAIIRDIYDLLDANRCSRPLHLVSNQPCFVSSNDRRKVKHGPIRHDGASVLYLFLSTFSHVLIITDDTEIHDMERPLPMHQIRRCIQLLKKMLHRVACIDIRASQEASPESNESKSNADQQSFFGKALLSVSSRTMRDLYDRSSRRPFCLPSLWTESSLMEKEIARCKKFEDYEQLLATSPVLRICPYMVSFKRRLQLFERIITTNRIEVQGENSSNPFHSNPLKPGIPVRISRSRLLEDGIATMNNRGGNMRRRIAVQYYNEAGTRESGIDAGGLFKEFWTDLCAIAFDPNYALFRVTDSGSDGGVGNCLYPNPSSAAVHGPEQTTLFAFLGRILGKALYEGITIHPKFAHFFLSFLKGDYNFLHMLPDLSTVDSQLYNNLMFLKTYGGDASDLALSFTVTVNDFGGNQEIPLIPNGANIDVTNSNKHLYIGLVAKYYVFDRIREQSEAMTRGLFEVLDRSWLRLFNEPELQVLISGVADGKLDVEDMKAHCHYAGGYSSLDGTVCKFWRVVASLDEKQQGALLRFVTSCERPPPLGFGSMNPPFTIQRVGILRDSDKLPTASTCFNILKLPTYSSEKVLRQRLICAIESGAGFELS
jgi:ubiquitin-protein ligase E3 C